MKEIHHPYILQIWQFTNRLPIAFAFQDIETLNTFIKANKFDSRITKIVKRDGFTLEEWEKLMKEKE